MTTLGSFTSGNIPAKHAFLLLLTAAGNNSKVTTTSVGCIVIGRAYFVDVVDSDK
jgi:hypothetical protein